MRSRHRASVAFVAFVCTTSAAAQRAPVLKQIDVPHPYYYREMYLPQLTTGPSGAAWGADAQTLVYSMAGSLWRQRAGEERAEELTAGPGYDYQPDWSRDGKWVVFARYDRDAIELQLLELATGTIRPLTTGGHVNVEPRFSPDGTRVAYVSTAFNKRFHIFIAQLRDGRVEKTTRVTEEREASVPRYYYGPFDHEISPTWSPDGRELIFVSNRGNRYGSGGLWRMKAEPGAAAREIRYEETTWRARPDWSPDGRRVVYASYLGRAWHQLWAMTAEGGDVFPLTYGEFDVTAPRFSHDGRRIAFVSNRHGNTALVVQDTLSGEQTPVVPRERTYRRPMARLRVDVSDSAWHSTSARLAVTGPDGRSYAPDEAWLHADDGFDRRERPFEAHYFHAAAGAELAVPAGRVMVEAMYGFEHKPVQRLLDLPPGANERLTLRLESVAPPKGFADTWVSGDLHVHMNYGGSYRNTPARLVEQAEAEDLDLVHNLIVNKEQRIPDVQRFTGKVDPASNARATLMHGQEFHTSYWGHLGLLNLKRHLLIPDYAGYDNTFAASLVPTNASVADLARRQGGLVGYVHPFDTPPDPADRSTKLTNALPIDVALGKVDYYEVVGFADHKASADVWYRLLNCGFRLPAGGGTDAMANFASLRGPVGMNRTYVETQGSRDVDTFNAALAAGRSFATNGPLLGLTVGEQPIGGEVKLAKPATLPVRAWMRSIVPLDHVQLVANGQVVKEVPLSADRLGADFDGKVKLTTSGWVVLRAFANTAVHPVLDNYPYATTSPIYVSVAGAPTRSPRDAAWFTAWIDRATENARSHAGYNTEAERKAVLDELAAARRVFASR